MLGLLLVHVALFANIQPFFAAEKSSVVTVYIDGKQQTFDPPAQVVNGRTLVPLRAIFEKLGAKVDWEDATQTVKASKDGKKVQLRIGSNKAYVNEEERTLDVPAQLIQDRTMVPARFVSEALGAKVGWDGELQSVFVQTRQDVVAVLETPEGITFESQSPAWDTGKLIRLYQDFLQNKRGEEMKVLSKVILSPERPGGEAGKVNLRFSTNRSGEPTQLDPGREIFLYHADDVTTIEGMASTLSHEYGHIFSFYWIIKKENKWPFEPDTGWAKLRNLNAYPVEYRRFDYDYSHFWAPEEIMADEYAMLYGSPKGKRIDIKEKKPFSFNIQDRIENQVIPSVETLPQIKQYWETLSGVPTGTPVLKAPELVSIKPDPVRIGSFSHTKYVVEFTPASDKNLQYFAVLSTRTTPYGAWQIVRSPIRNGVGPLVLGETEEGYVSIPKKPAYIQIYAFDPETKQFVYGSMRWFDFTDPMNPTPIGDQFQYDAQ
ncbi:hypothetical protein EFBL_1614 [Effusibacillus lacus]|uniref:Copper amine oxidase-like N-terminal domain-containing protein n=1 Tax=Effusibacillus lacus TaxID=1348429 RepID=A0A292YJ67_9BACL|nr:hypothetical protein EFBL_1614 [Effusibacillus lacus]